jgi:hypothetical protein
MEKIISSMVMAEPLQVNIAAGFDAAVTRGYAVQKGLDKRSSRSPGKAFSLSG